MNMAINIRSLDKTFTNGRRALQKIDLTVHEGEMVALIGASGSGKSTLLRHISGLMTGDANSQGYIEVLGRTVQSNGRIASRIRDVRAEIGFVFQQFNLVDRLPVITNVLAGFLHKIPLWRSLTKTFHQSEIDQGLDALRRVGIEECHTQRASTLSGGQQQRAAIARVMVQKAKVVLADEPIASLDPESSRKVMEILSTLNKDDRCTVIVSLHQVNVAMKYCPRTVALHQGRIVYDGPSLGLTPTILRELYGTQAEEILSTGDAISTLTDQESQMSNPQWPESQLQAA
jgi:phosphonate transport system ATP-binding protein